MLNHRTARGSPASVDPLPMENKLLVLPGAGGGVLAPPQPFADTEEGVGSLITAGQW